MFCVFHNLYYTLGILFKLTIREKQLCDNMGEEQKKLSVRSRKKVIFLTLDKNSHLYISYKKNG